MKRNKFSLSRYKLMSVKMGGLYPCGITEVLPGDTFQHSTSLLIRASPLVAPVMHPVHAKIHHWFVPFRILWSNWENFITGGPDGANASVFPTITLNSTNAAIQSLADYFGMPPLSGAGTYSVSALPFRAYSLIFNEWYRDQDLVTPLTIALTDGVDTTTNTTLQLAAWEKDYFTSARPWTQKGPTVDIPLTGTAPVIGMGTTASVGSPVSAVRESNGATRNYAEAHQFDNTTFMEMTAASGAYPKIFADLTNVTAANINDLRLAFALQRYQEARARYGSRYTEYLRYLGVRSSDARLQRPEYLGGGKQTVQFSEVLQTGVTTAGQSGSGVGSYGGHGIAALRSNRYRKFFEEHGYVISLLYINPRTVYANSLPRTFNRRVKEDFWQQELQHIGQQEVLNKEVYIDGTTGTPDGVFGYQDRYDEYRREESGVSGDFRSTLLNQWHMARTFASQPTLNASFVQSNPTNRIFADQTGDDTMYCMIAHSLQARRLVSKTGRSFIY